MVMKGKRLLPLIVSLFIVLVSFVKIVLARDNTQVRSNFSSQQVQSQKDPSGRFLPGCEPKRLSRLAEIPATITDSIVLGRKYLKRSVDLYPNAIL